MHLSAYSAGFSNRNYGCYIIFDTSNNIDKLSFLIIWKIVLDGKMNVIQIWRESIECRNVFCNFVNRSKTKHGINCMSNNLFSDIYGYRILSMHLLNCCLQLPRSCTQSIRLVKNPTPMTTYTSISILWLWCILL